MRVCGQRARICSTIRDSSSTEPYAAPRSGRAQPAAQDVLAADDEERQEAVVIIIAVEDLALLVPVDRIVGGIEIQDNLPGRFPMALQEEVHKKTVKSLVVGHDLLVAMCARLTWPAEFQAVQRAGCRQHMITRARSRTRLSPSTSSIPQAKVRAGVVCAGGHGR